LQGDDGASELRRARGRCANTLKVLDLSYSTTHWGVLAALGPLLPYPTQENNYGQKHVSNISLRELSARGCALGDLGTISLSPLLAQLQFLEKLDLANNRIEWEGVEDLALALAHCTQLRCLCLDDNPFGYAGVDALVDALLLPEKPARSPGQLPGSSQPERSPGQNPRSSQLQELRLADPPTSLATSELQEQGLAAVQCEDEGISSISSVCGDGPPQAPPSGSKLQELGLAGVECSDEGIFAVCTALAARSALSRKIKINMRRNPISPSGIAGALSLFEGAAVLAELDLSLAQGDDAASDRESVSPRVREGVRDGVREGVQEGVREGEREGVREGDGTASDLRRQNDEARALCAALAAELGAGGRVTVRLTLAGATHVSLLGY